MPTASIYRERSDLKVLPYAITRNPESLFIRQPHSTRQGHLKKLMDATIIGVPACLACYWLS